MFLGKFYYSIWADGIKLMQKKSPKSNFNWKFWTMFSMVFSFGVFSMFFFSFFLRLFDIHMKLTLNLSNDFWNNLLSAVVYFYLPWFVIHYYLVFWKNKYVDFLPKYKYRNGKLFFNFFLCLIFIPLAIFVIAVIIAKVIAN